MPASSLPPFDATAPDVRADPYPVYDRYRAADPVHRGRPVTPNREGEAHWFLFGYDEVAAVLRDSRFGREIAPALDETPPPVPPEEREPFWEMYSQWTLSLEPPRHTQQKTALSEAFTGRMVAALRPAIAVHAAQLLDELSGRRRFDVVDAYAFPLTLRVIGDLIGLPPDDLDRVKAWSLTIADVLDYKRSWDVMAAGNQMTLDFRAYLAALAAERRRAPQDDLLSRLLATGGGYGLDEETIISLCVMLAFAGHETSVNLISAGTQLLLSHPAQAARLRAEPALAEAAVDEILRFHSPIQATSRIAYADVTLRDRTIRRGEAVTLLLGSANRDPAAFDHPATFDIGRRPNRHLAFGRGIHYCLGAPLAVAQGSIALLALFEQFPDLRLSAEPPEWAATFGFRGLKRLVVETTSP